MSDTTTPVVEIVSEETVILPAAVPFYKNKRNLAIAATVAIGAVAAFAATKFLSSDDDAEATDDSNDSDADDTV